MNKNIVTLGESRLSYVHLLAPQPPKNPNDEPKYGCTVLLPKSDTASKARLDAAIAAAIDLGVQTKWDGVRPPRVDIAVYDGDGGRPSDGMPFGAECKGCWVISCRSSHQPGIVDTALQPIVEAGRVYSGVYARVNLTMYPYKAQGKKGIAAGLNHVMITRDGDVLGGGVSVAEAFGDTAAPQPASSAITMDALPF